MANVTIHEFKAVPDGNGDLSWPADYTTTIASTSTHALNNASNYVIITADADCRVSFETSVAAVASGMVILGAVDNPFRLRNGKSRTLKFL